MEKPTKNLPSDTSLDSTEIAKLLGSLGGKKTASKGKEYMKELGRKGAKSRWGKKVIV